MSYRLASGEQFVAVAVGGGGAWGAGDHVVAFRLPGEALSPRGHAVRWALIISRAIGMSETNTMPMATIEKLSLTIGTLPNA